QQPQPLLVDDVARELARVVPCDAPGCPIPADGPGPAGHNTHAHAVAPAPIGPNRKNDSNANRPLPARPLAAAKTARSWQPAYPAPINLRGEHKCPNSFRASSSAKTP